MQLFAIPIVKNQIVYYCHSNLPVTSRLAKLVTWSNRKWEELGDAKEDSWKKKLYSKGNDMMDKIDYQEWFLKGVPTREHLDQTPSKVTAYHPASVAPSDIERDLKTILKEKGPYHHKYMMYSILWVPISCTFVIVPLIPNIPLGYNLFRLYSHYKAYKGAQYLEHLLDEGGIRYQTSENLDKTIHSEYLVSPQDIVFPDDIIHSYKQTSKLAPHTFDGDIPGALTKQTISELAHQCAVSALESELIRARSQILTSIFLEKHKQQ
ncbi:mitochondrial K+-H+ exchange-related-domain-containing protein [Chlamydoabsidia padenii]|nr:mitochondrial K+-H+ exchange-related-domain-containing protein [Chlamydoabsidia padenii]